MPIVVGLLSAPGGHERVIGKRLTRERLDRGTMKARNDVMMSLSAFAHAGRAIERRTTRIRLVQPTSTFLYAEGATFVVDTPTGAEKIAMTGAWEAKLEIDARFFAALCGKMGSG